MTLKKEFMGELTQTSTSYGCAREHIADIAHEMADRIEDYNEFTLVLVGRKGLNVEVSHFKGQNTESGIGCESKTAHITMDELVGPLFFMETAYHLLHMDVNTFPVDPTDTEIEGSCQTVIDIGNAEGEGTSLSINRVGGTRVQDI